MNTRFVFKPVVYVVLAIYIALAYSVLAWGNDLLAFTVPEDHYFEIVGAFALFAASFLFLFGFKLARRLRDRIRRSLVKHLVYLGLALLFFVGAGEELSWGQRMLGFATPEAISQVNRQEEFNLHNLTVWETNPFLDADRLFDLFWFTFCVLIPAVALLSRPFRRWAGRFIPIVHWGISLLFLYNYLWAKLAKLFFGAVYTFDRIPFAQAVQEIKESNYAILFILVGLAAIRDMQASRTARISSLERGNIKIEPVFHD